MAEKAFTPSMAVGLPKIGLQLFTVQKEFVANPFSTLRRAYEIGATGVEFVGSAVLPIDLGELKTALHQIDLAVCGVTFEIEKMEQNLDSAIRLCHAIESPRLIISSIRTPDCKTRQSLQDVASRIAMVGKRCRNEGIQLLYHTHGFEMREIEGRAGIEWLLDSWDTDSVRLEIDTYWVTYAGVDPASFVRKQGALCESIHFKDMMDEETKQECELGEGIVDIVAVAQEGIQHKVEWFILEQEHFESDPWESVSRGLKTLTALQDSSRVPQLHQSPPRKSS